LGLFIKFLAKEFLNLKIQLLIAFEKAFETQNCANFEVFQIKNNLFG
jgi:hypothetical protein